MDATQRLQWDEEEEDDAPVDRNRPVGTLHMFTGIHGPAQDFPIYLGQNVIGRHANCDVTLPAQSVSKQHAVIEVQADCHTLCDRGSLNKTRRGKAALTPHVRYALVDGDLLLFADVACRYTMEKIEERKIAEKEEETVKEESDDDDDIMIPGTQGPLAIEKTPGVAIRRMGRGAVLACDSGDEDEGGKTVDQEVEGLGSSRDGRKVSPLFSPSTDTFVPESDEENDTSTSEPQFPSLHLRCDSDTDTFNTPTRAAPLSTCAQDSMMSPNVSEQKAPLMRGASSSGGDGIMTSTPVVSKEKLANVQMSPENEVQSKIGQDPSDRKDKTEWGIEGNESLINSSSIREECGTSVDDGTVTSVVKGQDSIKLKREKPIEDDHIKTLEDDPKQKESRGIIFDSDTDDEQDEATTSRAKLEKTESAGIVMDSDTDVDEDNMKTLKTDTGKEKEVAFNLDSDTDIEENDTTAGTNLPNKDNEGDGSDNDTDVEEDKIKTLATTVENKGEDDFHLDSDTDVEEDDSNCASTGVMKSEKGEVVQDSDTDVEGDVITSETEVTKRKTNEINLGSDTDVDDDELSETESKSRDVAAVNIDSDTDVEDNANTSKADVMKSETDKITLPNKPDTEQVCKGPQTEEEAQEADGALLEAADIHLDSDTDVEEDEAPPAVGVNEAEGVGDQVASSADEAAVGREAPKQEGRKFPAGIAQTEEEETQRTDSEDAEYDMLATQCYLEPQEKELDTPDEDTFADEPTQAYIFSTKWPEPDPFKRPAAPTGVPHTSTANLRIRTLSASTVNGHCFGGVRSSEEEIDADAIAETQAFYCETGHLQGQSVSETASLDSKADTSGELPLSHGEISQDDTQPVSQYLITKPPSNCGAPACVSGKSDRFEKDHTEESEKLSMEEDATQDYREPGMEEDATQPYILNVPAVETDATQPYTLDVPPTLHCVAPQPHGSNVPAMEGDVTQPCSRSTPTMEGDGNQPCNLSVLDTKGDATEPSSLSVPAVQRDGNQPCSPSTPATEGDATQPCSLSAPATEGDATQPCSLSAPATEGDATQPFSLSATEADATQPFSLSAPATEGDATQLCSLSAPPTEGDATQPCSLSAPPTEGDATQLCSLSAPPTEGDATQPCNLKPPITEGEAAQPCNLKPPVTEGEAAQPCNLKPPITEGEAAQPCNLSVLDAKSDATEPSNLSAPDKEGDATQPCNLGDVTESHSLNWTVMEGSATRVPNVEEMQTSSKTEPQIGPKSDDVNSEIASEKSLEEEKVEGMDDICDSVQDHSSGPKAVSSTEAKEITAPREDIEKEELKEYKDDIGGPLSEAPCTSSNTADQKPSRIRKTEITEVKDGNVEEVGNDSGEIINQEGQGSNLRRPQELQEVEKKSSRRSVLSNVKDEDELKSGPSKKKRMTRQSQGIGGEPVALKDLTEKQKNEAEEGFPVDTRSGREKSKGLKRSLRVEDKDASNQTSSRKRKENKEEEEEENVIEKAKEEQVNKPASRKAQKNSREDEKEKTNQEIKELMEEKVAEPEEDHPVRKQTSRRTPKNTKEEEKEKTEQGNKRSIEEKITDSGKEDTVGKRTSQRTRGNPKMEEEEKGKTEQEDKGLLAEKLAELGKDPIAKRTSRRTRKNSREEETGKTEQENKGVIEETQAEHWKEDTVRKLTSRRTRKNSREEEAKGKTEQENKGLIEIAAEKEKVVPAGKPSSRRTRKNSREEEMGKTEQENKGVIEETQAEQGKEDTVGKLTSRRTRKNSREEEEAKGKTEQENKELIEIAAEKEKVVPVGKPSSRRTRKNSREEEKGKTEQESIGLMEVPEPEKEAPFGKRTTRKTRNNSKEEEGKSEQDKKGSTEENVVQPEKVDPVGKKTTVRTRKNSRVEEEKGKTQQEVDVAEPKEEDSVRKPSSRRTKKNSKEDEERGKIEQEEMDRNPESEKQIRRPTRTRNNLQEEARKAEENENQGSNSRDGSRKRASIQTGKECREDEDMEGGDLVEKTRKTRKNAREGDVGKSETEDSAKKPNTGRTRKNLKDDTDKSLTEANVPEPEKEDPVGKVTSKRTRKNSRDDEKAAKESKEEKTQSELESTSGRPTSRTRVKRQTEETTGGMAVNEETSGDSKGRAEDESISHEDQSMKGNRRNKWTTLKEEMPEPSTPTSTRKRRQRTSVGGEEDKRKKPNTEARQEDSSPPLPSPSRSNSRTSTNFETPPEARTMRRTNRTSSPCILQQGVAPKVLFTGVVDHAGEETIRSLGGEIAESVFDCTHLVTDSVRRTVKFLCALARGIPIVTLDWLNKCKKNGCFLSPEEFLVKDKEQEKNFKFVLKESLRKAKMRPVFEGYEIHVTPSVLPEPKTMKDIIQCSGATFLPRMPRTYKEKCIIVSCEGDSGRCKAAPPSVPITTAEFVLSGILRQEANPAVYLLSTEAQETVPTPAKRRR